MVLSNVLIVLPVVVALKFKLPVCDQVNPELKIKFEYTFNVLVPEIVAEDPVVVIPKQFAVASTVDVPVEFTSKITLSEEVGAVPCLIAPPEVVAQFVAKLQFPVPPTQK